MGDRGGLGGRVVAEQRRGELLALARGAAQDRVDEAGGVGRLGDLHQLDRLVDGGVVGGPVGEEQLVEAEPQRRRDRRVEQADRPPGEPFDRRVGGAAPLHRAVGEPLRLRPVAPVQPEPLGPGAEGELGVALALEGLPQHLEGERPRRRYRHGEPHASFGSGVAAQVVGDRHRLAARRAGRRRAAALPPPQPTRSARRPPRPRLRRRVATRRRRRRRRAAAHPSRSPPSNSR